MGMVSGTEISFEISLRRAEALVGAAMGCARSLEESGSIQLPPVSVAEVDQAKLRAVAAMYLAAELEEAGVIPAAEDLARLWRSGSMKIDPGAAAPLLQSLWQSRNEHATDNERRGFFSSLFGAGSGPDHSGQRPNSEFEDLLIDLCEALYKLDEQSSNRNWGGVAQQTRLRGAARGLVANLLQASGGMTVFLAEEILTILRAALAILNHKDVRTGLLSRSLGEVVAAIDRIMRRQSHDFNLQVRRGQTGMIILTWLAEAAPHLETESQPIIWLDHPVIPAAVEWLQTSLALSDAQAPEEANRRPSWAALGG